MKMFKKEFEYYVSDDLLVRWVWNFGLGRIFVFGIYV